MAGASRPILPPEVREECEFDLVCGRVLPSSVKDPPTVVVRRGLVFFEVKSERIFFPAREARGAPLLFVCSPSCWVDCYRGLGFLVRNS